MLSIEQKLIEIFQNHGYISEVGNNVLNGNLSNMGINSLNFVKLAVDIERTFNFEFDDEDLISEKYPTINSLLSYIILKFE